MPADRQAGSYRSGTGSLGPGRASGSAAVRDPGERTRVLLRMWEDLARQHVSMGGGCACGIGGVTVRLQDFEHDIADYLVAEAERLKQADVLALLSQHVRFDPPGEDEIVKVLRAMADTDSPPPLAVVEWLLQRLERTLNSFAKLHGGAAASTVKTTP
ncbi:hypothetical protein [Pigmentiphaga litoralis]|uniref:hypothetical protein n=1 Tax=Pigmentiphaga litoralis TaxID=516702 RepID=UPI003B4376D3